MPLKAESLPAITSSVVKEVVAGSKATLECNSNDYDHNFLFWMLGGNNAVIGPGNNIDEKKYKYEVLSGKLQIDGVTPEETGSYKCISRKLNGMGINVGEVEMVVKEPAFSSIEAVKLMAIVISILVIIGCAVIYFRLRKEWNKYEGRSIVQTDDFEEEEGEEIYNRTTTAISQPQPQPVAGPSRNPSSEHLLYGIDNQGLDTDFNSVFENIQIKSPPNASLI